MHQLCCMQEDFYQKKKKRKEKKKLFELAGKFVDVVLTLQANEAVIGGVRCGDGWCWDGR